MRCFQSYFVLRLSFRSTLKQLGAAATEVMSSRFLAIVRFRMQFSGSRGATDTIRNLDEPFDDIYVYLREFKKTLVKGKCEGQPQTISGWSESSFRNPKVLLSRQVL